MTNATIKNGYDSYWSGKKEHNNPYSPKSKKHKEWLEGFESAKAEDNDSEE